MRVIALLAMAALGCGAELAIPVEDLGELELRLGKGLYSHVQVHAGDDIEVYLGPQGGHMLYACFVVTGVEPGDPSDPNDPNNPKATFRLFVGDQVVGVVNRRFGLVETAPGRYASPGTIVVFTGSVPPEQYLDRSLELAVRVVDAAGRTVEASVELSTFYAGEDDVDLSLL